MALISALSTGDPLFNEEDRREPVACVYQSAEDALDDTIKPRLDAAFADCERVFTIDERNDPLSFTDSRIEQAIRDTSAGLMILDPDMCRDLFEVIDGRDGRRSTIVISQLPVASWFDLFAESTYADACLTRLTDRRNAYRLEMNGKDMREPS